MDDSKLDTNQKAQRINFDAKRYGTFAEIGQWGMLAVPGSLASFELHNKGPGRI